MSRISAYNLEATQHSLRSAFDKGALPEGLYEPLQSLLSAIAAEAAKDPISVYLFSSDEDAEMRDLLAYTLARALREHISSALLVDCTFADVGMHEIVPQKDALGFLDFLLYGSSIGVITQETSGGVCVVGAGSFPVTRRMPFVLNAFEDAARRLVTHARCVIFVGPMRDDEGALHPLIGTASMPVFVRRVAERPSSSIAPMEEEIGARWNTGLVAIRVQSPGAATAPSPPPPPRQDVTPPAPVRETALPSEEPREEPEYIPLEAPQQASRAPVAETPRLDETARIPSAERRTTSIVPRIITVTLGLLVVAFIAWWFLQGRAPLTPAPMTAQENTEPSRPADESPAVESAPVAAVVDSMTVEPRDTVVTDPPPADPTPTTSTSTVGIPPPVDHTDTGGRTGGTVLIGSEDIHVLADLEQNWAGWWVIHISSFRESIKAREEVAFLESREFPVFIVFLDLGAKGKWYRVYAGPFRTRDAAAVVKKNLDDIPRVRFTRMTVIGE